MDMYSRNQYLKQIRSKYLKTKFKKKKGELMNGSRKTYRTEPKISL